MTEPLHAVTVAGLPAAPRGTVYVIQSVYGGPIKIGYVADIANLPERLRSLQTANPYPLRVVWQQPGTRKDEQMLHRRLWRHKLTGEWFEAAGDVCRQFGIAPCPGSYLDLAGLYDEAWDNGWERGYDDAAPCESCGESAIRCECSSVEDDERAERSLWRDEQKRERALGRRRKNFGVTLKEVAR